MRCRVVAIFFLFALVGSISTHGQTRQDSLSGRAAPVVFKNDTLFLIKTRVGSFSAADRAKTISDRILRYEADPLLNMDSIVISPTESGLDVTVADFLIMSVTDADAAADSVTKDSLAAAHVARIGEAIRSYRTDFDWQKLAIGIVLTIVLTVALFFAFKFLNRWFPKIYAKTRGWENVLVKPFKMFGMELLSAHQITLFLVGLGRIVYLSTIGLMLYFYLPAVFSFFPWTREFGGTLLGWLVSPTVVGLFLTVIVTGIFLVAYRLMNIVFPFMTRVVESWRGTRIRTLRIQSMDLLTADRMTDMSLGAVKVLRIAVFVLLVYLYLPIVFSFFTVTQGWASALLGYVLAPIQSMWAAFVNYLPNLFTLLVIFFITRYALRFVRFLFNEIGKEAIQIPGFVAEWAEPTYKIVRFLILAFVMVVAFPYLPGSDSPAFQGVSIFVGVLFSLGSTSAIANIVAGIVLTYMRPFKLGDRVKIADTTGDVVEKTLLVTRLRTIKNVDVTIPNAMVLSSHIINFSSSADDKGLILHTTVTIGYDIPWRKVHELLISSAMMTENVLKEPAPFVLQTGLNDYYPAYELNAYTNNSKIAARTYSELHQNIQDKFNEAGVEIMSPAYTAVRDGNQIALPGDYLPKNYKAPGFRLFGNLFGKNDQK